MFRNAKKQPKLQDYHKSTNVQNKIQAYNVQQETGNFKRCSAAKKGVLFENLQNDLGLGILFKQRRKH